jgi:hypothetical protein
VLGGWGDGRRFGMRWGEVAGGPDGVAVAADVDDVTVVQEPVDQRLGHVVIAEDLASGLEAFAAGEHR